MQATPLHALTASVKGCNTTLVIIGYKRSVASATTCARATTALGSKLCGMKRAPKSRMERSNDATSGQMERSKDGALHGNRFPIRAKEI